jgi:hydrogenase nickel incorporation protein HypA/HybF
VHELSIAGGILDIAVSGAGGRKVAAVTVVVGELSSVSEEPVRFGFEVLSKGTLAQDAVLTFVKVPASLRCRECQREFGLDGRGACPGCGKRNSDVVRGRECYVESIEVTGTGWGR